jgi:hypothetical protein
MDDGAVANMSLRFVSSVVVDANIQIVLRYSLKRVFRLCRCFFRGFKGFARSVGLGVVCHNLIVLAEHESG